MENSEGQEGFKIFRENIQKLNNNLQRDHWEKKNAFHWRGAGFF